MSYDFSLSRFNLIKSFLINNSNMDDEKKNRINEAGSVSEIWTELFFHGSFTLFKELLSQGMYPTAQELNEHSSSKGANAWFWLASNSNKQQSIEVLRLLLKSKIVPSAKALEERHPNDNTSAWWWLASDDDRCSIFQALLNKEIVPSAAALNEHRLSDKTCAWWWLAGSDFRSAVFQNLLTRGTLPAAASLNECSVPDNRLSVEEYVPIIGALIDKKIVPSRESLNEQHTRNHKSAWFSDMFSLNIPLFRELADRHILPDIYRVDTNDYRLQRDSNLKILNRLTALKSFNTTYDIDPGSNIAILLSREDRQNYYGFLYLLYRVTTNKSPGPHLPYEMWFAIAQYIIPALTPDFFKQLLELKNRTGFIKYHTINALEEYAGNSYRKVTSFLFLIIIQIALIV